MTGKDLLATVTEKPILSDAEKLELLQSACRRIIPYLDWTIGPESSSHHPTMPSAVGAFKHSMEMSGMDTSPKGLIAHLRASISRETMDRAG